MAKSSSSPSTIGDAISGILTLLVLVAVGYAAYMVKKAIDSGTTEAKESLAQKGVKLDKTGVAIKTDRRAFSNEEYVTNSSQAVLNSAKRAREAGAISFGSGSGSGGAEKRKGKK